MRIATGIFLMLFILWWESANENPYAAWRSVSFVAVCRFLHSSECLLSAKSTGQVSVPLCESWILTRIYCLEPIVLQIFIKDNKFVYSQLLCKYHGNNWRCYAWWKKNASAMGNREREAVKGGRKGQRCWLSRGFSFVTNFLAVWWVWKSCLVWRGRWSCFSAQLRDL